MAGKPTLDRPKQPPTANRWQCLMVGCCVLHWFTCLGLAQTVSKPQAAQVRILLVGDSTTAVQSGWGPGFCALLPPRVACLNMARSGRSSLSYRAEGAWAHVMDVLQQDRGSQATYVLIQFGHNDQPGKPGRSTDLVTEFPANLTRFVEDVRSTGATPVLITPLERRVFRDEKLSNGLLPWADATRRVAAAEHAPLIDLNALSFAAMQAMGQAEADTLAMATPPAEVLAGEASGNSVPLPKSHAPGAPELAPDGSDPNFHAVFDYTHLGRKGSAYFGQMVLTELQRVVPGLKPYLTVNSKTHPRP
jgi:lysophospholipase L1-like esterase